MRVRGIALFVAGIPLLAACHASTAIPAISGGPAGTQIIQRKSTDPQWHIWQHPRWFGADMVPWHNGLWMTLQSGGQPLVSVGMLGGFSNHPSPVKTAQYLAVGSDTNLWVTGFSAIAKLKPSGSSVLYNISSASDIDAITAGPDGALWFPFEDSSHPPQNLVGRITTSGSFTQFGPFPTRTNTIASGPDSNLWLGGFAGPVIYKLTTKGVETAYPVPTRAIDEIATGPDGALWFVYGDLVRMTTSGQVTAQYSPPNGGFASSLVVGPDKALWMAGYNGAGGSVYRFDPITHQWSSSTPSPPLASFCCKIVIGPDENVWFNGGSSTSSFTGVYIRMLITPTPDSITLSGAGQSQQLSVSESNFSGPWTVHTSKCSNIATVKPQLGKRPFTVTAVGPGSCEIDIGDRKSNLYVVPVTVH